MAVRDRLRRDAARYLEPGEQIQAVFYARRPGAQANDRAVAATNRRLLLMRLNFFGRVTGLLGEARRDIRLGPCRGMVSPIGAFATPLQVSFRFFKDVDEADRAVGLYTPGTGDPRRTLPPAATANNDNSGSPSDPQNELMASPDSVPETSASTVATGSQPPSRAGYVLSLAGLIASFVSVGLGITDLVAFQILPGYLVAVGMVFGFGAAMLTGITRSALVPKSQPGRQTEIVRRICRAAPRIAFLGFILLVIGSGNGSALNNAP